METTGLKNYSKTKKEDWMAMAETPCDLLGLATELNYSYQPLLLFYNTIYQFFLFYIYDPMTDPLSCCRIVLNQLLLSPPPPPPLSSTINKSHFFTAPLHPFFLFLTLHPSASPLSHFLPFIYFQILFCFLFVFNLLIGTIQQQQHVIILMSMSAIQIKYYLLK